MSDHCCTPVSAPVDSRYRRALWVALWVNLAMFGVEIVAGTHADSVALLADAVDFLGDAANYGISLAVLSMAVVWRSRTALLKGVAMGVYGLLILGKVGWNAWHGSLPDAATMGIVGTLALLANVSVAVLLYRFRDGDANMQSVWLCTRNDAIGNIAVMIAALGVLGSGTGWPDLGVALIMSVLGLLAANTVIRMARQEITTVRRVAQGSPP